MVGFISAIDRLWASGFRRRQADAALRTARVFCRSLKPGASCRELDCKSGAARDVVADVDIAAVLRDDSPNDRKTKATAPPFRGVVRQEELFTLRCRDAWPVVGHDDPNQMIR